MVSRVFNEIKQNARRGRMAEKLATIVPQDHTSFSKHVSSTILVDASGTFFSRILSRQAAAARVAFDFFALSSAPSSLVMYQSSHKYSASLIRSS